MPVIKVVKYLEEFQKLIKIEMGILILMLMLVEEFEKQVTRIRKSQITGGGKEGVFRWGLRED